MNSINICVIVKQVLTSSSSDQKHHTTMLVDFDNAIFKVEAWGQAAEVLSKLDAGTPILVSGSLNIDSHDSPLGFKEQKCTLVVSSAVVLPSHVAINNICLVGHTGRDPEVRYFESGKVSSIVSLAVRRTREQSSWFNLRMWNRTAEVSADYVRKGGLIGVQGRLSFDTWKDKNTDVTRIKPVIQVDRLDLLKSKGLETEQAA